jgi:hypothetical protein
MGPEFTVLRFDFAADVAAPEAATRRKGLPLRVLDIGRPSVLIQSEPIRP